MPSFEGTVILPVAPDRAFAILGDPANGPRIDPMIRSYEPEGGVMGPDVRNHIRVSFLGIPTRIVSITREWDPPRRMVLENIEPSRPVRMRLTQTFEPHPEGTLVRYRADLEGFPPAVALMRWFIARNFQRAVPRLRALVQGGLSADGPEGMG